ncbi:MAG: hypothetical protein ABSA83_21740 [Verrucomicrobiota bacterium]|jgi:hypothetical protein
MRKVGIILIVLTLIFYAEKERLLGWDAFYNPDGVGGDWARGSNTFMAHHPHFLEAGVFYNYLTLYECRLISFLVIGAGVTLICQSRRKKEDVLKKNKTSRQRNTTGPETSLSRVLDDGCDWLGYSHVAFGQNPEA